MLLESIEMGSAEKVGGFAEKGTRMGKILFDPALSTGPEKKRR